VYVLFDFAQDQPSVTLAEPSDFKRFHVSVKGSHTKSELNKVLTERALGWVEGDDAFVGVEAVRALASGEAIDSTWESDFQVMLDFAETKGWLSPDGSAIRAHVVVDA
jgi:hypothetical protein